MVSKKANEEVLSLLRDKVKLPDSMETLQHAYSTASPFPHLVVDNLFACDLLDRVCSEIPPLNGSTWVHHRDAHQEKFGLRSAACLGDNGFQFLSLLHSASFLYFLSELTGIWGLLPDPYLQGAGYHVLPIGAKFDVHIDRKTDYVTGLRRRLALIVYLNKGWRHEYGGQFELWNNAGTQCEAVVEPIFNRTVVFEVADGNYHGNPSPIACPPGETRNSFIVYYHTVAEAGGNRIDLLSSVFAPNAYPKRFRLRTFARDMTPPILVRTLNRIRAKLT